MSANPIHLRAGPIRMKFADGELRYLCVGKKEIARRLLFVVRDHLWDTAMPEFTVFSVEKDERSFAIELEANCRIPTVDYAWRGKIAGTPAGVITFDVEGAARSDFRSNRIGLCLLFGSESLAGQAFDLVNSDGTRQPGEFSRLVSPTLLGENFRELRYPLAEGGGLIASVEGAVFSMEDQRNYGDTSYKAYAPLPYAYPAVPAGMRLREILRLGVEGTAQVALPEPETMIRLGDPVEGSRIPRVFSSSPETRPVEFFAINTQQVHYQSADRIQFGCNPALHLPDDDTLMENAGVVRDQVRTARSFAPRAKIRIDPITFNSPHRRPGPDPRHSTDFGAAWSALVLKHLAIAGVDEAGFAVDGPAARAVQKEIGAFAGCAVLETIPGAAVRPPVDALAVATRTGARIWLINTTADRQRAGVLGKEGISLIHPSGIAPFGVIAQDLPVDGS